MIDRSYYKVSLQSTTEDNNASLVHCDAPKSDLVVSNNDIIKGNEHVHDR